MNPNQPSAPTPPPTPPSEWPSAPQQQSQAPVAPNAFNSQPVVSATDTLGENYLNQISATEPVRLHKFALIGIIGGVLVLLVVILSIMMNSGGPSLSTQAKAVNGRIATLKTIVDTQQKHLGDNSVTSTNAILSSVLTTLNSNLNDTMKAKKIVLTKTSGATVAEKAYASKLTKKLDDSYQRGTLDRTYAPQMAYELSILRSKIVALKNTASSKSVTQFSADSIKDIDALITSFKEFSSAN